MTISNILRIERRDVNTYSYYKGLYCFERCVNANSYSKICMVFLSFLLLLQIEGKWKTVAIASSRTDKIEIGGELRILCREITCDKGCKEINIKFYVK